VKDLYGQRHIAYFDPSSKFEHVESIEHEDAATRFAMNGHRMKNVSYYFTSLKKLRWYI
jgi:sortase (surface protein transpeptidase)